MSPGKRQNRNVKKALNKEHGSALIEGALAVPFIVIFVFLALDVGRLAFTAITLQYSLNKTARWTILGETLPDQDVPLDRLDSIAAKLQQETGVFGIDLSQSDTKVYICPIADTTCLDSIDASKNAAAASGELFRISVETVVPFFMGWQNFPLARTVVAKNENF